MNERVDFKIENWPKAVLMSKVLKNETAVTNEKQHH